MGSREVGDRRRRRRWRGRRPGTPRGSSRGPCHRSRPGTRRRTRVRSPWPVAPSSTPTRTSHAKDLAPAGSCDPHTRSVATQPHARVRKRPFGERGLDGPWRLRGPARNGPVSACSRLSLRSPAVPDRPPEELGHRRRPCPDGRADDQRALVAPERLHRLRAADDRRGGDGLTEISDDAPGQVGRCGTVLFVPGHLADHHADAARSNACHPQCARAGEEPRVCRRVVRRGDGRCAERGGSPPVVACLTGRPTGPKRRRMGRRLRGRQEAARAPSPLLTRPAVQALTSSRQRRARAGARRWCC